jgi:UDP-N-acetylglucosamine--N-acetylmuramyl-(pentapeptide) pyrophosphoryl-undecaprenol N-acetylglucosamine transferase
MSARTVLIMAGGTGGHVFPALALARTLQARAWKVVWLGTRRGLEARVVPAERIPIEWLSIGGLRGKGLLTWIAAPLRVARALIEALGVMRRQRPHVVVGLGGFVTGPGGVAAWLMRRPLLIHEQNAIAGFTNRCLARLAREVLCAFPDAFGAGVNAEVIGNPVRHEIAALPPPAARFAARAGPIRLLVVGGSLGAARLNTVVPHALARLGGEPRLDVWHQAGERGYDAAVRSYAEAGQHARLVPFIEDMAAAYAWADLVICRAGALTISELAATGVGAILVPFPAAVDDHQTRNAEYLASEDAAVLIADRELAPARLERELRTLCAGRGRLLAMAERARLLARSGAAEALAGACERWAREAA